MSTTTTQRLGPIIKAINTQFERQLTNQLGKPKEAPKLTSSQFGLLSYLFDHKNKVIYQRDLETIFNLSRPTINGLVKRLKQNGFVDVIPVAEDKRYKQVVLLPEARQDMIKHHEAFEHDYGQVEARLTQGLSADEIATLTTLLEKCRQNMMRE